ncbi:MAG: hypothetical protein QNJ00_11335 [Woeseiaceae bacterium]|nr:hypothetical protein [Woeseiaceae bacterium]
MSANQSHMERMQILVPSKQKARMKQLAAESNVSMSEIYRRAADAYTIDEDADEIQHPELEALVEGLKGAIARANTSMDRAEREVRATIDFYKARKQQRESGE